MGRVSIGVGVGVRGGVRIGGRVGLGLGSERFKYFPVTVAGMTERLCRRTDAPTR